MVVDVSTRRRILESPREVVVDTAIVNGTHRYMYSYTCAHVYLFICIYRSIEKERCLTKRTKTERWIIKWTCFCDRKPNETASQNAKVVWQSQKWPKLQSGASQL